MATPKFILDLREHIGHAPLWLSGVTAVVVEEGRILLNRRSDSGRWALLHGIVEPGEQPADAVVREVLEETGVTVRPERISSVFTLPASVCANGDRVQFLNVAFRCRYLAGDAHVNDDESLAVDWYPLDALPPLSANDTLLLDKALADAPAPWFALG
ncbi:NUDIX hydrolase [Kitasatospora sp. CB01950]|uniref:NUDIX hydrolase n=1 Tax=Kitasatospora sp. CB01950 TaxID=1703930 RepID=UPI000939CD8B|nr:NUDIX domain-containing protein [Kitasatospora sp. CB01950]OKJ13591.1 NUDIX hydrolase [Kitasatospora sp. CB01950]